MKTFYVALHVRPAGAIGLFCDRTGRPVHADSTEEAAQVATKLANEAGWEVGGVAWTEEQK